MKKETRQRIIDTIIGSSKHEDYIDDGINRSMLERKAKGEITSEEVKRQILSKYMS